MLLKLLNEVRGNSDSKLVTSHIENQYKIKENVDFYFGGKDGKMYVVYPISNRGFSAMKKQSSKDKYTDKDVLNARVYFESIESAPVDEATKNKVRLLCKMFKKMDEKEFGKFIWLAFGTSDKWEIKSWNYVKSVMEYMLIPAGLVFENTKNKGMYDSKFDIKEVETMGWKIYKQYNNK